MTTVRRSGTISNGPEYISGSIVGWPKKQETLMKYNQPGKRQQNIYVERFYNAHRRHSTIGYVSPAEFELLATKAYG